MDLKILNLTMDIASINENKIGIEEPNDKEYILSLLKSSKEQEIDNAHKIADYASLYNYKLAVIGGCEESFYSYLETALVNQNIKPLYKQLIDGRIYLIESSITKSIA